MKIKSLVISAVTALAVVAIPVSVYAAGQIEGGNIYRVRNVTQNTDFTDPVSASRCEVVQFRVRIHNPGPDPLTEVNVHATLPSSAGTSHSSTVTVSSPDAVPTSVTDTAGVTLNESLSIAYVPGSTQLLDPSGSVISTLPDTITTSGVSIGTVGVSTEQRRSVQFSAQLNCPETPTCPEGTSGTYPECVTPPETPTTPTPEFLPETGAGNVAAIFAAVTAVSAVAYSVVSRRFNS